MNKNYVDQENMEEMGLKEESISKKNEKNVNERHDQDGQRYEDGTSMNGNKDRQENDLKRYRDGTSMRAEKENRQKNGDSNPENQDEIYYQKVGQEESPGNQGYRN
jgi:hypothetical protein